MSTLGFDQYVDPLKVYLSKYREVQYCVQQGRLQLAATKLSTSPPECGWLWMVCSLFDSLCVCVCVFVSSPAIKQERQVRQA